MEFQGSQVAQQHKLCIKFSETWPLHKLIHTETECITLWHLFLLDSSWIQTTSMFLGDMIFVSIVNKVPSINLKMINIIGTNSVCLYCISPQEVIMLIKWQNISNMTVIWHITYGKLALWRLAKTKTPQDRQSPSWNLNCRSLRYEVGVL
jgi:hypothetical protein